MASPSDGLEPSARVSGRFTTTHWSVVLAVGRQDTPQAAAALEQLCRTYWYPLYAYVRRCGYSPEDAEDLTQAFFACLLEKRSIAGADPVKGRFRSFLLGALKHFLADERDRAQAKKRGGGQAIVSWEQEYAEERFGAEPADELSPDKLFDRRWALTVLERATNRLRAHYQAEGQAQKFDALKSHVTGDEAALSYAQTAIGLGISESAVKSAIYRLRQCYHELVRDEVAQTVADSQELEAEICHLMTVFSTPTATL